MRGINSRKSKKKREEVRNQGFQKRFFVIVGLVTILLVILVYLVYSSY